MSQNKSLEEIIQKLPPKARHELEDFAHFLWERINIPSRRPEKSKKLKLDWRGGLKDLKDQFTSVELQHQTLKAWGKNVSR